jgi:putative nucleotidyltransferase with HDIG domain
MMREAATELLHIAKDVLSSRAEKEVERLLKSLLKGTPFAGKAFATGGYVRDEVMGLDAKDLDIAVEMRNGSEKITKFIYRKFPSGQISRPRQMGAAYPIWQITFKDNVEFDGETYRTKGAVIEFADTQTESFPDPESRQRVVEYGDLKQDVERRDFTVNMLMKDLSTGEVRDLTGTSINDIKKGILRGHPGVDFNKILRDDPLRMMRLIRFQAKYGWKVPLSVLKIVKRNAGRIKAVSGERIRDELIKVMKLGKLAQAIKMMKVVGLLKYVFPEIEAMKGVEHEQSRGVHQEGDVLKHTLLVLKSAKPGVANQLAALLHDVGKPRTQETIEGLIRFIGHEKVSGEIAEAVMRRLKFEKKDIKAVRRMVENHMRPHGLARNDVGPKALRKFVRNVGEELVDAVLDLAEADSLGNLPPVNEIPRLREMIEEATKDAPVSAKPPLDGNEVQRLLGIKPGRQVGEAMKFLLDKMDEYAAKGRKLTKPIAEKLLLERFLNG